MRTNVTAILVARSRGDALDQTVAALKAQTLAPDRVIVVAVDGGEDLANHLSAQEFELVLAASGKPSFGNAVKLAVETSQPLHGEQGERREWLWLLAEDSAPEPDALAQMLFTVQSAGSATVAGPKIVDWYDPSKIIELGEGLTWAGSRWMLDNPELDQQQYDHLEDVLGVGSVGMLVRRDVWQRLGGFDPALPVYDDGLDFSVRARRAGYRVVVVPRARLRFARSGIAGAEIDRRRSVLRKAHRQARTAQLHRRLTYAPAVLAPLYWLALPIVGVLGMLWALIRERPGTMLGEQGAALTVFFRPGAIMRSRRNLRRNSTNRWSSIRSLRTDRKTVRDVRAVRREAILAAQGRQRQDLHFISTGGLALIVASAVLSLGFTWWLLGASFATGGGLAPLSGTLGALWSNTVSDAAVNFSSLTPFAKVVPADPFTWVLALLGTLTFWNPSFAPVLVLLIAIPTATLGGWLWGAKLTEATAGRVLSGIVWGVGPMLLGAIASGRLPAVILAMVLPWLLLAVSNAHRSWSWAATASLLAAIVLASAPILIPAAVIMLVVAVFSRPKKSARLLSIAIAPLALFAPKLLHTLAIGRPLDLLIDPGIIQSYLPGTKWHMLLGFPTFGLDGWGKILADLEISTTPATLTVGFALIPLALLALLGTYTGHPRVTLMAALAGVLGLTTALVSARLLLTPVGDQLVPVWAGSGLALYWAAMITLAATGAAVLRKAAAPVLAVAVLGVLIVVAPSLFKLASDDVAVRPNQSQLPAVAEAAASADPLTRTLTLSGIGSTNLRAIIIDGDGTKLDELRTALTVRPMTDLEERTAELVAGLASTTSTDLSEALAEDHINFVLLTQATTEGTLSRTQLQSSLDQNPALTPVGETARGVLWRVNDVPEAESVAGENLEPVQETSSTLPIGGGAIWITQLALLLAMLLLALPTGEVRERPPKRKRLEKQARKRAGAPQSSVAAEADSETDSAAGAATNDATDVDEGETHSDDDVVTEPSDQTDKIQVITHADLFKQPALEPEVEATPVEATPVDDEAHPEEPPMDDAEESAPEESAPEEELVYEVPDTGTIRVVDPENYRAPETDAEDDAAEVDDADLLEENEIPDDETIIVTKHDSQKAQNDE